MHSTPLLRCNAQSYPQKAISSLFLHLNFSPWLLLMLHSFQENAMPGGRHCVLTRLPVSELDTRLQEMAGKQSTEEVLIEIDHFHNQFYIQQLNIHDLKHAIRSHQLQIDAEMKLHHGAGKR